MPGGHVSWSRPPVSNETAVGLISAIALITVSIIAWLTRDKSPKKPDGGQATQPPASPVDDYEKLANRLNEEIERVELKRATERNEDRAEIERLKAKLVSLLKDLDAREKERELERQERQTVQAEASHLRQRVVELETSEKNLKAEVARLRGLVEKPGTGPLKGA
jgi:hypothetical protein